MPRVKLKDDMYCSFWIDSNCSVCARVIEQRQTSFSVYVLLSVQRRQRVPRTRSTVRQTAAFTVACAWRRRSSVTGGGTACRVRMSSGVVRAPVTSPVSSRVRTASAFPSAGSAIATTTAATTPTSRPTAVRPKRICCFRKHGQAVGSVSRSFFLV